MSPTARSLKYLRDKGYTAAVVEKFNPHVKIRQDLFGFGDILCFNDWTAEFPDSQTNIIQSTTTAHINKRLEKIVSIPAAKGWCKAMGRNLIIHGWSKKGARGKRKTWQLTERWVKLSDFK